MIATKEKKTPKMKAAKPISAKRQIEAFEDWQEEIGDCRRAIGKHRVEKELAAGLLKAAEKGLDTLLVQGPEFQKQGDLFAGNAKPAEKNAPPDKEEKREGKPETLPLKSDGSGKVHPKRNHEEAVREHFDKLLETGVLKALPGKVGQ